MKSLKNINDVPAGLPLAADDLLEFHAARLLLLFKVCGVAGRIDGLTKMAKLDFFVRYPQFFNEACKALGLQAESAEATVESSMIRFHYGPWDDRYYHVLAFLEATGLLELSKVKNAFTLKLTDKGQDTANQLVGEPSYASLVEQMKRVKKSLGGKAGSSLKKLIYTVFEKEVGQRPLGETIE
jgi:hypothetical protein